jgi:hypothetical protein
MLAKEENLRYLDHHRSATTNRITYPTRRRLPITDPRTYAPRTLVTNRQMPHPKLAVLQGLSSDHSCRSSHDVHHVSCVQAFQTLEPNAHPHPKRFETERAH